MVYDQKKNEVENLFAALREKPENAGKVIVNFARLYEYSEGYPKLKREIDLQLFNAYDDIQENDIAKLANFIQAHQQELASKHDIKAGQLAALNKHFMDHFRKNIYTYENTQSAAKNEVEILLETLTKESTDTERVHSFIRLYKDTKDGTILKPLVVDYLFNALDDIKKPGVIEKLQQFIATHGERLAGENIKEEQLNELNKHFKEFFRKDIYTPDKTSEKKQAVTPPKANASKKRISAFFKHLLLWKHENNRAPHRPEEKDREAPSNIKMKH